MKLSVIRNVMMVPMLPMAETFGQNERVAIIKPIEISMIPITFDKPCSPKLGIAYDPIGLLVTKGSMFLAS